MESGLVTGLRPSSPGERRSRCVLGPYSKLALISWLTAFLVMSIRLLRLTHRGTLFDCYIDAGHRWRNGAPIYTSHKGMGFVYSPLSAAYFAALSFFPAWMGKVLWLLTNIALLLGGTYAVMRENLFCIARDRARALVFVILLPLSLAGLDVAQSNSALIGLLLIAVAMASAERWTLCVIAICLATYLKIYPMALGLLLCLYKPGKVTWRLALAMLLFGILGFLLQNPHYVLEQYHAWIVTRAADDRRLDSMTHAPLDLWFLTVRLGHLPLSERSYTALQILSGAAIGVFCLLSTRWRQERRLAGIFVLCSCWMILLGPATESYTFAILAPAVSFGTVAAFTGRAPRVARILVALSLLLLLCAQVKSMLFASWRSDPFNATRPVAALFFLAYAVLWLKDDAMWKGDEQAAAPM
jgi:hypothetical protein